MKKVFVLLLIVVFGILMLSTQSDAKKSKKSKISDEEITEMSTTIDTLTQKMYAHGLFSPQDNANLISIKLKLDNQMLISPDPSVAPYYYKLGVLLRAREMKDEAIESFQTILENFSTTAFSPKAMAQLKAMGVAVNTIATPQDNPNAGDAE